MATEINGDHYNRMSVARFELERARRRIEELEATLRAVHVSAQNALWRNTAVAHENAAKEILKLTSDYASEER